MSWTAYIHEQGWRTGGNVPGCQGSASYRVQAGFSETWTREVTQCFMSRIHVWTESRVERYDYSRLTGMTRLDRHVAAVPLNLSESRESSFLSASEVSDTPASATYPACHVSHDELVSRSRRSMSHSSLSRSESVNQGSVTFRRCWA